LKAQEMNRDLMPTFHQPDIAEFGERIGNLCSHMEKEGLHAYICFSPDNIFYLTNFANYVHERPFILIVKASGDLSFIIPKLEASHVALRSIGQLEIVEYSEFPARQGSGWIDRFRDLVRGFPVVGVESTCPWFLVNALESQVKALDLVDEMRAVKSPYELGRIQYSCDLASKVHADFLASARPGMTMLEASSAATGAIMGCLLADEPSLNIFATKLAMIFQPPDKSDDPHNFTDINMKLVEGGPHVSILNGIMNGYGTEIERTFFLGRVPEAARRPFEAMLEARHRALAIVKPGNLMSDVDRAANESFRSAGFGDNMLHRAGHGIGVTGHEGPFFAEGYDREILPGMVFTIEPGIYLPGVGGFRHSDTIRVDSNGPVLMTKGSIDLQDLVIDY
jgi:Xaa-Pro dipeptidase